MAVALLSSPFAADSPSEASWSCYFACPKVTPPGCPTCSLTLPRPMTSPIPLTLARFSPRTPTLKLRRRCRCSSPTTTTMTCPQSSSSSSSSSATVSALTTPTSSCTTLPLRYSLKKKRVDRREEMERRDFSRALNDKATVLKLELPTSTWSMVDPDRSSESIRAAVSPRNSSRCDADDDDDDDCGRRLVSTLSTTMSTTPIQADDDEFHEDGQRAVSRWSVDTESL